MISHRCPNPDCPNHLAPSPRFCRKDGHYRTRWNRQLIQRYECKGCGRKFSSHSFNDTNGQHRPDLNRTIFGFYCSAMTQRRLGLLLGCSRSTIARKFYFLAAKARQIHDQRLQNGELKTSFASFDEMESYVVTRKLPFAIALAVRNVTGEIIDARVASMPAFGRIAGTSVSLYGRHPDERLIARRLVLSSVSLAARDPQITIVSDDLRVYGPLIREVMPQARHTPYASRLARKGERNPLFMLNHVCALIRADLSRMSRRTWTTSKTPLALQRHLDLYIGWRNGYQLG